MATNLNSTLLVLVAFLSFSSICSPVLSAGRDEWCDKTPHPKECKKHFAGNNNFYLNADRLPAKKVDYRKTAMLMAFDREVNAGVHVKNLKSLSKNEREKAAWADCTKLFDDAALQLNRTLDPASKCTDFDSQTWLSTALTNLDTCRSGLREMGVSDRFLPVIMSNDVPKLICNTLALNKVNGNTEVETTTEDGFPTWVKAGDRKLLQSSGVRPNAVVAQDGSGNYRTIKAALDAAAKRRGTGRFVIRIKAGVYQENLEIGNSLKNIMLVGDGIRYTIITGSRSVGGGFTTFNSATVAVTGGGFIAQGITFRNTAGPQNYQAVALRSGSDLSVFHRCSFEGYQDTLYVHSQRQFYRDCYIYGTVDFIFGNAAAVLQNCMIYARRPMAKQKIAITAQGRTDLNQNTGIVVHGSRVMAAADLKPVLGSFRTFLGRPWKQYSRTVFMKSYFDSLVDPAGWLEWDGDFALRTLYYGEFQNFGPGSSTARRVRWGGYRVITSPTEASRFTVGNFLAARSWLPATGVPFSAGL